MLRNMAFGNGIPNSSLTSITSKNESKMPHKHLQTSLNTVKEQSNFS